MIFSSEKEYFNTTIEQLFEKFLPVLGKDYQKYKNHVYRVFLNCRIIDTLEQNEEKYAIAAVFHDIGIWTNHTIDYLAPSIEQLKIYLTETGKLEWTDEISAMIYWHHKITSYQDKSTTIENFRKADWIDVSFGIIHFGADSVQIKKNRQLIPNCGFHLFLLKKIGRNLLQHPLRPLPMFRK